jgi:hypothetical protein
MLGISPDNRVFPGGKGKGKLHVKIWKNENHGILICLQFVAPDSTLKKQVKSLKTPVFALSRDTSFTSERIDQFSGGRPGNYFLIFLKLKP